MIAGYRNQTSTEHEEPVSQGGFIWNCMKSTMKYIVRSVETTVTIIRNQLKFLSLLKNLPSLTRPLLVEGDGALLAAQLVGEAPPAFLYVYPVLWEEYAHHAEVDEEREAGDAEQYHGDTSLLDLDLHRT